MNAAKFQCWLGTEWIWKLWYKSGSYKDRSILNHYKLVLCYVNLRRRINRYCWKHIKLCDKNICYSYHVRVVEISRTCHLGETIFVASVELDDAKDSVPGIIYIVKIPPSVTKFGNFCVIRLKKIQNSAALQRPLLSCRPTLEL